MQIVRVIWRDHHGQSSQPSIPACVMCNTCRTCRTIPWSPAHRPRPLARRWSKPLLPPPLVLRCGRRLRLALRSGWRQGGLNGVGRRGHRSSKMLSPVKPGVRYADRDVTLASGRHAVAQARDADAPADAALGKRPTKRPATERFSEHPAHTRCDLLQADDTFQVVWEPQRTKSLPLSLLLRRLPVQGKNLLLRDS